MTSAAFVSMLKTQLEARFAADAAYADVAVHLYQVDVRAPAVVLIRDRIRHTVDYTAMGKRRTENVTIPCLVGTTAATLQAAADRAEAIVREVADELRTNEPAVGVQSYNAKVSGVAWMPLPSDKGGTVVDAEFDITYTADID